MKIEPLKPAQIREVRGPLSPELFAKCLQTTAEQVKHWESGEEKPVGPANALLEVLWYAPSTYYSIREYNYALMDELDKAGCCEHVEDLERKNRFGGRVHE